MKFKSIFFCGYTGHHPIAREENFAGNFKTAS